MSRKRPKRTVAATVMRIAGFSLARRNNRTTKGTPQFRTRFSRNNPCQGPCCRRTKYSASSGLLTYQMSMYWLNQMYIQKLLKANKSVPRSRHWSLVSLLLRILANTTTAASVPRNMPEKLYTPKTVLDHLGSRDMIQSVLASQQIKEKTTRKAPDRPTFFPPISSFRVARTSKEVMVQSTTKYSSVRKRNRGRPSQKAWKVEPGGSFPDHGYREGLPNTTSAMPAAPAGSRAVIFTKMGWMELLQRAPVTDSKARKSAPPKPRPKK